MSNSSSSESVSVSELFEEGSRLFVQEHAEREKEKVGILRAGNTGMRLPDGTIIGKCARQTFLRYKGVPVEGEDYSRELMFDAGRGNEDLWYAVLSRPWPGSILREEEIPIYYEINGRPITGRPDLILVTWNCSDWKEREGKLKELANKMKEPIDRSTHLKLLKESSTLREGWAAEGALVLNKGIELKLVSSVWTARDVAFQNKPKMMHLLQAAHYSWKLGDNIEGGRLPFELWYTSRTDYAVMGWAQKHFPRKGQPGSEKCDYGPNGDIRKVLPFKAGYELRWEPSGHLSYRRVNTAGEFVRTIITVDYIRSYFESVIQIEESKQLPPRPKNLNADGSKGSYEICNYCPLKQICDSKEGNFEEWTKAVSEYSENLTK